MVSDKRQNQAAAHPPTRGAQSPRITLLRATVKRRSPDPRSGVRGRGRLLSPWPTTALSTRSSPKCAHTSKTPVIESSDRLWEVEEILQRRIVQGQGLRAKRRKQYLVRWTPSLLSAEELLYAPRFWKIVKISQDIHVEKGGALDQKIRVQWAPSWVSSLDFGAAIGALETASHLSV